VIFMYNSCSHFDHPFYKTGTIINPFPCRNSSLLQIKLISMRISESDVLPIAWISLWEFD